MVLDVVHNHLGPSGNYLPVFGPYFTDTHHTPWGVAVNLDAPGSDEVRAYLVESALAWLRDYRLDGLRLDAVHALVDTRACHFLEELSTAVDTLAADLDRPLFLIAESDLNDPRIITPRAEGGLGVHAQWNDDFHHALHAALTGESQGYYADFARDPFAALAKTLTRGYFHDGTWSSFRGRGHGRRWTQPHGRAPADRLQPDPRPGRQPRPGRPPGRAGLPRSRGLRGHADADRAVHADAVHGRGVGGGHTVAVLHRPHRPGAGRGGAQRQAAGVRRARLEGGGRARPAGPGDARALLPRLVRAGTPAARARPGLVPAADRPARGAPRPDRPDLADTRVAYDGEARWLAFRRGDVRVVVNLGTEPAQIPLGGRPARVLAAWDPVEAPGPDGVLRLPGESSVVLAQE